MNGSGWGNDAAYRAALETLSTAAASDLPILVRGESGTGKELVARAIHACSPRAAGPFVTLDCGAIPDALADGELFGHARGAYTGAVAARAGLVETAAGGTLFLDEIGDASPLLQMRLLRLLAEGTFRRLGETRVRPAHLRFVAATHRDLDEALARGRFRSDLWYRLAAVEVVLPPLRARGDDVLVLARGFLERSRPGARFARSTERTLAHYAWPGNVRELEWAVAHAAAFAPPGRIVRPEALPVRVRVRSGAREETRRESSHARGTLSAALRDLEVRCIAEALHAAGGRTARAATALGISRQSLWRRMRRERSFAARADEAQAYEEESWPRRR